MKLAFINYIDVNMISSGLAYVMTAAEKQHEVRLYDINSKRESFEERLNAGMKEYCPDFILFSVHSFSLPAALYWARLCKSGYPDLKVVFGGVHPTLYPENTINHDVVDYICIGEGEEALVDLLSAIQQDADAVVPGFWKKGEKGSIIKTPRRPYIEDIDLLPMLDLDRWDMSVYLSSSGEFGGGLGIISSRGCPYNCNFCSAPGLRKSVPGRYYRLRSPAKVAEEIDFHYSHYKHLGIEYFHFDDACFGHDTEHLEELSVELARKGFPYGLPLTCQVHPADINRKWAALAVNTGIRHVSVGVESGDENIRFKVHNKRVTNIQIKEAEKIMREAGLLYSFFMILGAPGETWLSTLRTAVMLVRSDPAKLLVSFFTPLPGSKLAGEDSRCVSGAEGAEPHFVFSRIRSRSLYLVSIYVACKAAVFVLKGLRLRKFRFPFDVIGYIINYKGIRSFPLFSSRVLSELYRKTVIRYEIRN